MKSKKAILMPETLKIIIAVISIVILLYLAVSIFGIFTQKNQDKKFAENHMNQIENLIGELDEGESRRYTLLSPDGWVLSGWPEDGEYPNECSGLKSCLCLCDSPGKGTPESLTPGGFLNKCNELGVCKELDKKVIVNGANLVNAEITENNFPISIDKLKDQGRDLIIRLDGEGYIIVPE
jgi:hypothetical protein